MIYPTHEFKLNLYLIISQSNYILDNESQKYSIQDKILSLGSTRAFLVTPTIHKICKNFCPDTLR